MLGASYDKDAVRRTRRELSERVRNDWEEVLARSLAHLGDADGEIDRQDLTSPPEDALEWRERTYASSDPSSGESTDADESLISKSPVRPVDRLGPKNGLTSPARKLFRNHHCMFPDGSDADGDSSTESPREREAEATRRRQERKSRRRRRLEEEMSWNEGLSNWERTRDVWCRARRVSAASSGSPTSSTGTSLTSTATVPVEKEDYQKDPREDGLSRTTISKRSRPALTARPPSMTTQLPVPPPLIPSTDPGRANITSQYTVIYEKVVIESLRPQVPINLSQLVPALVKGWKDNNEWPPKPGPATATLAASKQSQAVASSKRSRAKHRSIDLAEKGRRFLWASGSSPKGRSPDNTGENGVLHPKNSSRDLSPPSPRSSHDHNDKDSQKGSPLSVRNHVARMSKALMGSLSGTGDERA